MSTNFSDGSNVLVIPVDYTANTIEVKCGEMAPYKGWTNVALNIAVPTLNINYLKTFSNSGTMQTVIIPYTGSTPPNVTVKRVNGIVEVSMNDITYRFFLGNSNSDHYEFNGTAAMIRSNANHRNE